MEGQKRNGGWRPKKKLITTTTLLLQYPRLDNYRPCYDNTTTDNSSIRTSVLVVFFWTGSPLRGRKGVREETRQHVIFVRS